MEELIPIFLFLSVAAVLILRPISKRIGSLLEAMARQRQPVARADENELTRIRMNLEHMARRLDLVEERLDFTERLIGSSRRSTLPLAGSTDAPARRAENEYYGQ